MSHSLLKFDGEAQQRSVRQFQTRQAAVGECDVCGALRLGSVPALARCFFLPSITALGMIAMGLVDPR
jgi:hypothetical protein